MDKQWTRGKPEQEISCENQTSSASGTTLLEARQGIRHKTATASKELQATASKVL